MVLKTLSEQEALVAAVEKGVPQKQLMETYGYKTANALKLAYLNALAETGRVSGLKTERKKKAVSDTVTINSRGSLVIPKALVDRLDLDPDAIFKVKKSGTGLSLTRMKSKPKTILRKNRRPSVHR
jgi:bifunctional DNA-binding transcriptional regulator/antitoxin component of YhaV-PrlF toxin-antitoxin module